MSNSLALLKWPGGKRALLKDILPLVPDAFNRYYEPFVGGGALFFALHPLDTVLADSNKELMNCYKQVRDHPKKVIASLSTLKNTKEDYYAIRASVPANKIARAARFLYLMALSFNGVHRVNTLGQFNVPYSYNNDAQPCDPEKILAVSASLSERELREGDFELTTADAEKGDFIYFDPPYTVTHGNNGFIKYNAPIFSWDDQLRLAKLVREMTDRGCYVLVSNADHPAVWELYDGFLHRRVITRPSSIAASNTFRRDITECLFHN